MAFTPVKSSLLAAWEYDADSATLAVQFHPRKSDGVAPVYRYAGVDVETFNKLQAAASAGKAFNATIKGHFEATKIEEEK